MVDDAMVFLARTRTRNVYARVGQSSVPVRPARQGHEHEGVDAVVSAKKGAHDVSL